MKRIHCSQEAATARAAAQGSAGTGEFPAALAAHAAECEVCGDVAQTARWMRTLAASGDGAVNSRPMPQLPDARGVWRRAVLSAEQQKTEKIRSVLEYAQMTFAAAAPIGLASWVVWNWYAIEAAAAQFLLSVWPQLSLETFALASLAPVLLTLVALALGFPLFASE